MTTIPYGGSEINRLGAVPSLVVTRPSEASKLDDSLLSPEGLEAEAAKQCCLGQRVNYIFYINHPRRVFTHLNYCNRFSAIVCIYCVSISSFPGDFSDPIGPDEFDAPRDAHPPCIP